MIFSLAFLIKKIVFILLSMKHCNTNTQNHYEFIKVKIVDELMSTILWRLK